MNEEQRRELPVPLLVRLLRCLRVNGGADCVLSVMMIQITREAELFAAAFTLVANMLRP